MWPKLSIVIPVYNSENTIFELYNRLIQALQNLCSDYEILLIDDGSCDCSYKKMKELRKLNKRVKIVQLFGNFGQQNALMCGIHYATGKYLVTMDDDLQHPPEEIEKLLFKLNDGFDVVYGISENKKHSLIRNIGSKMTNYLFQSICRKPKDIRVSSFRVMTKDVVEKIIADKTSFVYISAILFKFDTKIGNVFVRHDCRKCGESNYNIFKLIKLFMKLYIYYSPLSFYKLLPPKPQFIIKDMHV